MSDCVIWPGPLDSDGYGQTSWGGKTTSAHRAAWLNAHGAIPDGLELDHLCRNRACVNVDHLEPVTHAVNMQRAFGTGDDRTECKAGHVLADVGVYTHPRSGHSWCKACKADCTRRWRRRRADQAA